MIDDNHAAPAILRLLRCFVGCFSTELNASEMFVRKLGVRVPTAKIFLLQSNPNLLASNNNVDVVNVDQHHKQPHQATIPTKAVSFGCVSGSQCTQL